MMEDITNDATLFQNRRLTFEHPVANARPTNRDSRIDVVTDRNPPDWIEYKWTENGVSQETFIAEFIERDLFSVPTLSQLQWRIKGKKLTKADVLDLLSSADGRLSLTPMLNSGRLQALFPPSVPINSVDDFINEITKDAIYNSIFK